jgi:hypothetical protein
VHVDDGFQFQLRHRHDAFALFFVHEAPRGAETTRGTTGTQRGQTGAKAAQTAA